MFVPVLYHGDIFVSDGYYKLFRNEYHLCNTIRRGQNERLRMNYNVSALYSVV